MCKSSWGGVTRVESSDSWRSCLLFASVTACGLVASNLNLKPGECLKVRSEVTPDAKSFVPNLGKDSNNLCLHFKLRSNAHGDANTTVCNHKDNGARGTEHQEPAFPFQPGSIVEVCITFGQAELTIKLPDGHEFKFPNRLNMEAINYMAAEATSTSSVWPLSEVNQPIGLNKGSRLCSPPQKKSSFGVSLIPAL
ncbi:galectin-1-like protein [Cricetulus griseus]|nr:galectin-1-like protein [Cricetulus griseus]